jgi:hypothetical protein
MHISPLEKGGLRGIFTLTLALSLKGEGNDISKTKDQKLKI